MSAVAQLRNLTSSQLKVLNQFSKNIIKSAYEQGSVAVNKEWIRMIQQLPTMLKSEETIKSSSATTGSSTQAADAAKVNVTAAQPATVKLDDVDGTTNVSSSFGLPQVLNNLKLNFSTTSKQNAEANQQQTIPQWKVKKSVVVAKVLMHYPSFFSCSVYIAKNMKFKF